MFERLTIKTDICIEPENEIVYHNPNDPEGMYNILDLAECLYSGGEAEAGILMEISRRLAAYEDSGLSPEEIQALAQAKADGRLVVNGQWKKIGMRPVGTRYTYYCSVCGGHGNDEMKYCPNCGAKMDKEAAEKALSPICNTTKLPCAECNPCCEHRRGE